MPDIIDVSQTCGQLAGFLAGSGVHTVIRYYSRDTGIPAKRLTRHEAQQFDAAGIRLAIVHEARHGNKISSFSHDSGVLDGAYARSYGANTIGQPANSAIYFGVDLDTNDAQINNSVLPFFRGVAESFNAANGLPTYKIGVYGSGATCAALLDARLAEFAWLAQSTGWRHYEAFRDSNRWSLLQEMPTTIGELECDPDVSNGAFGDFALNASHLEPVVTSSLQVNARSGLRLRSGPGAEFDILQTIPFGTAVHVIKTVGDWAQVDLAGDRAADGFVNSHFLQS
jgi:hypothetical protein